jgi:hypothetical protein
MLLAPIARISIVVLLLQLGGAAGKGFGRNHQAPSRSYDFSSDSPVVFFDIAPPVAHRQSLLVEISPTAKNSTERYRDSRIAEGIQYNQKVTGTLIATSCFLL